MTEDEIVALVADLPGVRVVVAGPETGAPEAAWGDSFCYYDPDADRPLDRGFPFATIVTHDHPGFDELSRLDRPGVFRLNVAVGRTVFEELFGHPPAVHAEHRADYDHAALDTLLPHPVYARQSWVAILNPGRSTDERVRALLRHAHRRAVAQYRPHRTV